MNWLTRFFSSKPSGPTAAAMPGVPDARRDAAVSPGATHASTVTAARGGDECPPLLPWLLGSPPVADGSALSAVERQALAALDATLALPTVPDDLLPRAATLVPQMLAMLRQADLPVQALAQRVAKDVQLTAEVMRLAGSPHYRGQGAVSDLGQAIMLIGVAGLNTVIARVVLKPIYEGALGPLSARAAPRLWEHADALATHTSVQAAQLGAGSFDGTLAGLLHGCGYSVSLRLIDRTGAPPPLPHSAAFSMAIDERAHRLFGLVAQRWNITPAFSAFAADARVVSLAASVDPLARALLQAQSTVLSPLAPAAGGPPGAGATPLRPVR